MKLTNLYWTSTFWQGRVDLITYHISFLDVIETAPMYRFNFLKELHGNHNQML